MNLLMGQQASVLTFFHDVVVLFHFPELPVRGSLRVISFAPHAQVLHEVQLASKIN